MAFIDYIHDLIKHGKCCFSIWQAQNALTKSNKAIYSSIEHLLKKGELVSPAKGFYVIVPPEYQVLGCLPAEQFVPHLMDYWGYRYYVGLLSAAQYHGATHQAAQIFQVMIEGRSRPPIACGKVKIQFVVNRNLVDTPTQIIFTPKSMLTISTPEGTAMDLLKYPNQSGGVNHIATLLAELQEIIDPEQLLLLLEKQPVLAWKQRLGYLLEKLESNELAEVLKTYLAKQKRVDYIPLMPKVKISKETPRNSIWKIIENVTVESDV